MLFENIITAQLKNGGRLFDVITMDPPWILSSGNPTRGVATNYDTLTDNDIMEKIPFNELQKDGFLYELDGAKEFPIKHGPSNADDLLYVSNI